MTTRYLFCIIFTRLSTLTYALCYARGRFWQTCAKITKRSGILDPQDQGFEILEDLESYIFIFFWDLRDLESCHNIVVES